MQFTTKTILVLFIVVASSFAAFGLQGIVVSPVCAVAIGFSVWQKRGCVMVVVGFVLVVMLLIPGIVVVRGPSRRMECQHNLKQIGLALHYYHHLHSCFPPAYVTDDQDNRLHSWRLFLLPHLDEMPTYQAYNFNEPWNGPNNCKRASPWHPVYECPSVPSGKKPAIHYLAVTGPGTAWPGNRGSRLDEFTDGPENTILLIELSDSDVEWLEPRDVTLDEALGPPGGQTSVPRSNHYNSSSYFFHRRPIAGHVLMADGSVRTIEGWLSREDLAALLSIAGGEKASVKEIIERNIQKDTMLKYFRWDHFVGLILFAVSLIWFWQRLLADSKLNPSKVEKEISTVESTIANN